MRIRRVGFALLLVALVCATVPVLADSTARIVRLSYLDGDVQIDRGTGNGFQRAVLNMPVVQGTQLSTAGGATAEVEFEDGSTLRLVPDTAVEFRTLSLRSDGDRASAIELGRGTVYLEATTKKDQFSITSGGQEIRLTHDARLRANRSGSQMTLAVFKGEVDVQNAGGTVQVKKDETLNLNLKDPSQYELAKGIDSQSYDSWSKQRDNYRQTYAANHRPGYNSFYSYGWSDLNYFGSFNQYGSYGTLWRPFGVGPSWDPFADGAWMFYPGSGYMWVSGYPWGWMPYRYGAWQFVPGFGWAWSPGTVWNTWYAMPVIYSAPAGYVAPRPPVVSGTGKKADTVVVGSGPINDVRNQRYKDWLKETKSASPRHRDVTPVAAPTTMSTSQTTTTRTGSRHEGEVRQEKPAHRHATPPSEPPPTAAAPASTTTVTPAPAPGTSAPRSSGRKPK